ncbi:heparan-alpha-glucosaminide N-acetyltransferase domain-containing protein [Sphingomonas sp. H39-1-10]|uniref:acyltransferase family protein n=1 Tax=Sphingomonas pollutisoli TaxID=3030829 RepID=UPI0023B9B70A|nr:heparan-alpha-glucosaminide N-acetyltransferase domain-containing protein [Sphingomonas pollutisoli]MDF0486527.1 heparan-alpha-glucosaminide N-acetyltransferase domain-containing protein [Sphingomonas pollutisoli]
MTDTLAPSNPRRFTALDVFRGLTIFLMILVNTAGPGAPAYPTLVHAKWFGFTMADAIFPSFLFAMGNAMSFASRRRIETAPYLARLLKRGAIIFALGFLMYWFPFVARGEAGWAPIPFALTRVPGVLQRLALCYVAAGLLVRWLGVRQILIASALLLLGYWAMLVFLSPPGMAYDKFGTIGTRLDLWLFGPGHLYKKDGGFDPEGLLGTLPAIVNVLAGYLAGLAVQRGGDLARTTRTMAVIGVALIVAGLAWSPWFPLAKKLWTGSYVLLTIGIDCVALAAIIALVEIIGVRRGTRFFIILGRNPLAIYLFSELFVTAINMIDTGPDGGLYGWIGIELFQRIAPGAFGSLLCALAYTMLCWSVGWWMDRKGLILKA